MNVPVAGLWEALQAQFFLGSDSTNGAFVNYGTEFVALAAARAGYHFAAAGVLGDELFYTYTAGSGFLHSLVGRIRVRECAIERLESAYLASEYGTLFVSRVGDSISVERGAYVFIDESTSPSFNEWTDAEWLATIASRDQGFDLIDGDGHPIRPSYSDRASPRRADAPKD